MDDVNNRLDIVKEKINDLEDVVFINSLHEMQRQMTEEMNTASVSCERARKHVTGAPKGEESEELIPKSLSKFGKNIRFKGI